MLIVYRLISDRVSMLIRYKEKNMAKKTPSKNDNDPQKYTDLFLPLEELWMEKNVINTFVIDDGGSVVDVHFSVKFEDDSEEFYVVLDLTVSGIDSLSDEAEGHILDEIEWAMDDIRDTEFSKYGLDPDNYLGEEINLIVEE